MDDRMRTAVVGRRIRERHEEVAMDRLARLVRPAPSTSAPQGSIGIFATIADLIRGRSATLRARGPLRAAESAPDGAARGTLTAPRLR